MKFEQIIEHKTEYYEGEVYDLTVEDSHSYNVDDIMVHNSGAGSLVLYTLGITEADPLEYDLLFERFLNPDRGHWPDVDCDFDTKLGPLVFKHINEKYGNEYCSNIITFTRMQPKVIIADVARCLDIPASEVKAYTTNLPEAIDGQEITFDVLFTHPKYKDFFDKHPQVKKFVKYYEGLPRSTGQHAAGIGISSVPVKDISPVILSKDGEVDKMYLSVFEKENYEHFGLIKFDILKLKNIRQVRDILTLVNKDYNLNLTEKDIKLDDKKTWDLINEGNTAGVFQFGDALGKKVIRQVHPDNIEELGACNAFIRPGASGITNYVNGKNGSTSIKYEPRIDKILEKTYGAIVFQEQIMSLISELIGVSFGKADIYRRALEKPKKGKNPQLIEQFNNDVKVKAVERGYSPEVAETIRKLIIDNSGYGFNKCLSGEECFYRDKNQYNPLTIEQMFLIKNDADYARSTNHWSLHQKYNKNGYGTTLSMNQEGRLVKNNIKDITFSGLLDTYTVILETGQTIRCTMNHKFPTKQGIKLLSELQIGDELYIYDKYEPQKYIKNGNKAVNIPTKGQQGFQHISTINTKLFDDYRLACKQSNKLCEKCNENLGQELHHKDGNNKHNVIDNFEWLCISCHKKQHYKMGRTKRYGKGILTKLSTIVAIKYYGKENTYNVEMQDPYHNFVTNNKIVTCNSHAVCYSIISYQTAWCKANYPLHFYATMINDCSDADIAVYLSEAKKMGISILPPDINKSNFNSSPEGDSIRIGFNILKGIGDALIDNIIEQRPYNTLDDFFNAKLNSKTKEVLINTNALANLPISTTNDITLTPLQINKLSEYLSTAQGKMNYAIPFIKINGDLINTYDFIVEKDNTVVIPAGLLEEFQIPIKDCILTKEEPKGFLAQYSSKNSICEYAFKQHKDEILNLKESPIQSYTRSFEYLNFPIIPHPCAKMEDKVNGLYKGYINDMINNAPYDIVGIVGDIEQQITKNNNIYYNMEFIGVRETIIVKIWDGLYESIKDYLIKNRRMVIKGYVAYGSFTLKQIVSIAPEE